MRGQPEIENDEQLRKVLQSWEVDASLPPRFKEEVWRRIGQRERNPARIWDTVSRWIERVSQRPALAGAYVAVALAIGTWAGLSRAEGYRVNAERSWQSAYVRSVSPIAQAALKR